MKKLILFISIVFLLLIATTAIADEPTAVYSWVTEDGVASYTDRAKAVPPMYEAKVITVNGLANFELGSVVAPSTYGADGYAERLAHLRQVNAAGVERRARLRDCTGHVLVTSQRVQDGDYNRRTYVATDECGRTTSVTAFYPSAQINR